MTNMEHLVTPEDIMALLDGELSNEDALTVRSHVDECAECAKLAEDLRATSQSLAAWTVPSVPQRLDRSIHELTANVGGGLKSAPSHDKQRRVFGKQRSWVLGPRGAVAAALGMIAIAITISSFKPRPGPPAPNPYFDSMASRRQTAFSSGGMAASLKENSVALTSLNTAQTMAPNGAAMTNEATAPMIARTVALSIVVKDVPLSRSALDAVLARHHGYAAQLNINTPENYARSFQASLRIPAPELNATLAELRSLGYVQSETQSGEEVTQQHTDLVARLKNSRETEERLRAILQQRTGKVEEVLQVEEQISNVRGEIERMEAEQKALEHRVDFATVELQLSEEYKAQLNSLAATSVGTRMHNALVTGIGNAGSSLLGIVLFFEEAGPVLLVWLVILGTPAILVWRRYRKARMTAR